MEERGNAKPGTSAHLWFLISWLNVQFWSTVGTAPEIKDIKKKSHVISTGFIFSHTCIKKLNGKLRWLFLEDCNLLFLNCPKTSNLILYWSGQITYWWWWWCKQNASLAADTVTYYISPDTISGV